MQDDHVGICVTDDEPSENASEPECDNRRLIPPEVAAALRANPGAYLAGTLGPDVYPDFVTAQVTVHPGVENGWQTDDWLRHLLERASTPEELAWTYGYLTHAASDIFAHTWANRYAGEIFDIGKHQDAGNEAELRHFLLERYIAWRTPDEWEAFGEKRPGPLAFLANQLIFDRDVEAQYRKQGIPLHLVAMAELRKGVADVHQGAKNLASKIIENGLEALSPLRQAEIALQGAELGLQGAQLGVKTARDVLAERDRLIGEAEGKLLDLARIIDENPGTILGLKQQIEINKASLQAAEASIGALIDAIDAAEREFNRLNDILNNTVKNLESQVCEFLGNFGGVFESVCKTVTNINPAWQLAEANANAARAVLDGSVGRNGRKSPLTPSLLMPGSRGLLQRG